MEPAVATVWLKVCYGLALAMPINAFEGTLFRSLAEARTALAAWRTDYNASRPHSRLVVETALSNLERPKKNCSAWPAAGARPAQLRHEKSTNELMRTARICLLYRQELGEKPRIRPGREIEHIRLCFSRRFR